MISAPPMPAPRAAPPDGASGGGGSGAAGAGDGRWVVADVDAAVAAMADHGAGLAGCSNATCSSGLRAEAIQLATRPSLRSSVPLAWVGSSVPADAIVGADMLVPAGAAGEALEGGSAQLGVPPFVAAGGSSGRVVLGKAARSAVERRVVADVLADAVAVEIEASAVSAVRVVVATVRSSELAAAEAESTAAVARPAVACAAAVAGSTTAAACWTTG